MDAGWYYARGTGERHGPVDEGRMRAMAADGTLGPDDLVWRDGMPNWLPALRILAFWATPSAAPSAPATPGVGSAGFRQIGGTFSVAGAAFYGEAVASDGAIYLILRQRRSDLAVAAGGVAGGLIGGAIAGAILAVAAGPGKADRVAMVRAGDLPPAVRGHPSWPAKRLKDDVQVVVIPRGAISSPPGIVHPKFGNLLVLNFAGQRVKIEYTLFRGSAVRAFLERAGWPVVWGGSKDQLNAALRAERAASAAANPPPPRKPVGRRVAVVAAVLLGVGGLVAGGVYLAPTLFPKPPAIDLVEAAKTGDVEAIRQHKRAGTDMNPVPGQYVPSPLCAAVEAGQLEATRALLDAGADPNRVRDYPWQLPVVEAVAAGHYDVLQLLLDRGADLHARSPGGWTLLHYAAGAGSLDGVRLLVGKGLAVDARSGDGQTPLSVAAALYASPRAVEIVGFLLDRGADPNAKNVINVTPLQALRWIKRPPGEPVPPALAKMIALLESRGGK